MPARHQRKAQGIFKKTGNFKGDNPTTDAYRKETYIFKYFLRVKCRVVREGDFLVNIVGFVFTTTSLVHEHRRDILKKL